MFRYPGTPNGYGIIFIPGSGWGAPPGLDATPLKENSERHVYAGPLVAAGYTVFAVNHRAAPRFPYPAAVEDVQRAVRFVRYHATRYGVSPDRIGAMGGSSGGHLASLLGVLDGGGQAGDRSPIIVSVRRCRRLSHVAREWIFVRAAATISLSDTSPPFPVSWDTDSLNRRTRVRETTAGMRRRLRSPTCRPTTLHC